MITMEFGWLPSSKEYRATDLKISPSQQHSSSVTAVLNSGCVHKDWFHVPLQHTDDMPNDKQGIPVPWFTLPSTHTLECIDSSTQKYQEYIITIFGWLMGLKLQPKGWGHFYRVAIKQGTLNDFIVFDEDLPRTLDLASKFWTDTHCDDTRSKMFGVIHWFLFSQSYAQYFEKIMMQYTVFDSLFNIHKTLGHISQKHTSHPDRLLCISDLLGIPLPDWGKSNGQKAPELTNLRNELVHEAKFYGEPIGFSAPNSRSNILLELECFNSRVIAATLGATGNYTRSLSTTRQTQRFSVD